MPIWDGQYSPNGGRILEALRFVAECSNLAEQEFDRSAPARYKIRGKVWSESQGDSTPTAATQTKPSIQSANTVTSRLRARIGKAICFTWSSGMFASRWSGGERRELCTRCTIRRLDCRKPDETPTLNILCVNRNRGTL